MFASGEVSGVKCDFVRDIRRDATRCQQQVHDIFVGSYFVRGSMDRIDIDRLCGGVGAAERPVQPGERPALYPVVTGTVPLTD